MNQDKYYLNKCVDLLRKIEECEQEYLCGFEIFNDISELLDEVKAQKQEKPVCRSCENSSDARKPLFPSRSTGVEWSERDPQTGKIIAVHVT